jgi:hypothetical protein
MRWATDHDELTNKRDYSTAKAHSCSIEDVHTVNRDAYLKRTLALQLMRPDLGKGFRARLSRTRRSGSL